MTIIVQTTNSIWFALALVMIGLWRVFAVRPRFWVANIRANMVNAIVSFGYVILLYTAGVVGINDSATIIARIILTLFYIAWLLVLKPGSKRINIVCQAAVALLVGTTSIYTISYNWPVSLVIALLWVVGYSSASHVFGSYDEEAHTTFLSITWGLVIAELGWLGYHWTIAYRMPLLGHILVPQISIIMLCVSFVTYKSYDSYTKHDRIRLNDIFLPLLFSSAIIVVLLSVFNSMQK